jgi:Fe-S-cluster containining protein
VEDERIKEFFRQHSMQPGEAHGGTCPYLNQESKEGGCTIYPVRPLICRLYGTSPDHLCKMGVRPLRLLQEDEEADIWHHYRKNFF